MAAVLHQSGSNEPEGILQACPVGWWTGHDQVRYARRQLTSRRGANQKGPNVKQYSGHVRRQRADHAKIGVASASWDNRTL